MAITYSQHWRSRGTLKVVAAGIERYKLRKVIQKQPIMIADVELFPEEEDISQQVKCLISCLLSPAPWIPR